MSWTGVGRHLVVCLSCCCAILFCWSSNAQDRFDFQEPPKTLHAAPPDDRFPESWYSKEVAREGIMPAPVVNSAYTADTVSDLRGDPLKSVAAGTDGLQMRDRDGRVRVEAVNGSRAIGDEMVNTKSVEVADPVSHCRFRWTELVTGHELPAGERIAFVACSPRIAHYQDLNVYGLLFTAAKDGTVVSGDRTTRTEHLAPLTVNGISIERLRVSNTDHDSSGQPRTRVTETWYSPDLKELVGLMDSDGYSGLVNTRRSDPDPKLFYPPPNFRIELDPVRH